MGGFKKEPRKVDQAVFELGRLTQQYRLLTEHSRQMLGRVEQDEERVQELEEQVAELKQRWQAQAQANADNPVIREGVQQLMSQAEFKAGLYQAPVYAQRNFIRTGDPQFTALMRRAVFISDCD